MELGDRGAADIRGDISVIRADSRRDILIGL